MSNLPFHSAYARFDTPLGGDSAMLAGSDNLVGDTYTIEFVVEQGVRIAWLVNRFGARVGFLAPDVSRSLSLCEAKDMELCALLSFVAFHESTKTGRYWGEVALVCYPKNQASAFTPFINAFSKRLADGVRPDLHIGEQGYHSIIDTNGSWQPTRTVPLPSMPAGSAIVKSRRTLQEKLIEEGRNKNKGCYALSWLFLLAVLIGAALCLKSCFGF